MFIAERDIQKIQALDQAVRVAIRAFGHIRNDNLTPAEAQKLADITLRDMQSIIQDAA